MPSLTDLFNPSFLMFLGILVLVISLLFIYFETKYRDQNHKISSMLSLVSSLAEELNAVKFGLNQIAFTGGMGMNMYQNEPSLEKKQNLYESKNENTLITVSDDEDSDSDSDDSDSDINADDDSEDDSEDEINEIIDLDEENTLKKYSSLIIME